MKSLVFVCILLASFVASAQSDFEKRFAKRACDCITDLKAHNKLTGDDVTHCFSSSAQADSLAYMAEVRKAFGDTSYENDMKFMSAMIERVAVSMVKDCDAYFLFMDSIRYQEFLNLNSDSLKEDLSSLNYVPMAKRNAEYYSDKTLLMFQLKWYDSTLINANLLLAQDSINTMALYFKAWVEEMQEKYDNAIATYEKLARLSPSPFAPVFTEIARRKKLMHAKKR